MENSEREIQENVIKMRYLEGQANAVRQQMIASEELIIETATALNSLKEINKLAGKQNSLTPLGSGIFIPSTIEKQEKVLVDIGSGIVSEKTVEEATKMLEERQSGTKESIGAFSEMLQSISQQYEISAKRVQELRK